MSPSRALRVLRVLTRPNLGGPTRQAIALWHAHRALGIETLLVTGRVEAGEDVLSPSDGGVPRVALRETLAGAKGGGWLELPELRRGFAPRADRRVVAVLRRVIERFAPDVVHTHTSKAGWLGRRAAFDVGVRRVAHTFHGHVLRDYFGPVLSSALRRRERRLAERTDCLFAVSPSCAEELAALGIAARERFRVVPPAVAVPEPVSRGAARERLGLPADAVCLAAVGRLVPIKRLDDFVALVAADPSLRGDLHGDGPLRPDLAAAIERSAPGRLRLLGATREVGSWLAAYDALVLPSVREGCPLVAIEAFAAGIPVLGYDVPGVRDALAVWGRGVLVPEREGPAGLRAAVANLLRSEEERRACVETGREALARFAPAAIAETLAASYAEE